VPKGLTSASASSWLTGAGLFKERQYILPFREESDGAGLRSAGEKGFIQGKGEMRKNDQITPHGPARQDTEAARGNQTSQNRKRTTTVPNSAEKKGGEGSERVRGYESKGERDTPFSFHY